MVAKSLSQQFKDDLTQYDPSSLLRACAVVSSRLDKEGESHRQWSIEVPGAKRSPPQNIVVTHHGIAAVAMRAMWFHPWSGGKQPSDADVIRLLNNSNNLEDPLMESDSDPHMLLVRLAYAQFPYQEAFGALIPRWLNLLLASPPPGQALDIDQEMRAAVGLSVKEFMAIGFAFLTAGWSHAAFNEQSVIETPVEPLKLVTTPDKVAAFLRATSTTFYRFREECNKEVKENGDLGAYQFNPLIKRPIVVLPNGQLCVPVPRLLVHRITKGIYFDLLDRHSHQHGNTFAEWFGLAFEEYGGVLLRHALPEAQVFSEPKYGKQERRGPDWVVIQGGKALVLEFRSGRLPKQARARADYEDVLGRIRSTLSDTAAKFPKKIEALRDGSAGIPTEGVSSYTPAIVTLEPWYPEALTLEYVRSQVLPHQTIPPDLQLMSISDLEWLLAWAGSESPVDCLTAKLRENPESTVESYVDDRARSAGVELSPLPLLDETRESFFEEMIAPSSAT